MINRRYLIFLCLLFQNIYSGFSADTLVKRSNEFVSIDQIAVGDQVVFLDVSFEIVATVQQIRNYVSTKAIQLLVNNEILTCALEQKFWLPDVQLWKSAKDLQMGDMLLQSNGDQICIDQVNVLIDSENVFYELSTDGIHLYYVTKHKILTHNFPFVVIGLGWAFGGGIVFEGITASIACLGVYFGVKLAKDKKKSTGMTVEPVYGRGGCPNPGDPEDPKKCKTNNPFGEYENNPAHHKNSRGGFGKGSKSPCPKNGQAALNNSVRISDNVRVGVSEGELVELRQHSPGKYHGNIADWKTMHIDKKNALVRAKLVNNSGKIL